MKRHWLLALIATASLIALGDANAPADADWPEVSNQTRPWTRWWWMGSAVTPDGITRELEAFKAAGLGGVEITPIYGVRGADDRFVQYLSPEWVQLLEHTLNEAQRLGLGVDMATGTGWPFGGPWVSSDDAPRTIVHRTFTVEAGARLAEPVRAEQEPLLRAIGSHVYEATGIYQAPGETPRGSTQNPAQRAGARRLQLSDIVEPVEANKNLQALAIEQVRYPKPLKLQALVAYSDAGEILDLTERVSADGTLDWIAPAGTWTLYAVFPGWHGKLVERAAPGGEGNVIDHFAMGPIRNYLTRFDTAFGDRRLVGLRAFFNDSYEVDDASGQGDWTPALLDEFMKRRGYDLRRHLPALFGKASADENARVLADYRETISDLLLDTFTREWRTWSVARGAIVRNQAHGSPANLLDLYAASDIPETEGTEILRFKWASSAAHVAGRRLVAAEAATWLNEHFRSTLGDIRRAVDNFFLGGVNHLVYHGTNYSPESDAWPGWLFYAAVHMNPRNSWWTDATALHNYVARVQSFLQAGRPDHDVLLYYPEYDALTARSNRGLLLHFGAGQAASHGAAFETSARALQTRGFTYDFISDRQLQSAKVSPDGLATDGGTYRVIVVPESRFMHLSTLERLLALASEGATIIVHGSLPQDVAGLADLEARRARFRQSVGRIAFGSEDAQAMREASVGRGRFVAGTDLERLLTRAGVRREAMVNLGLQFVRRAHGEGRCYFLVNRGESAIDGWVPLAKGASAATIFDPIHERRGAARVRTSGDTTEVYLQLAVGESRVIAVHDTPSTLTPFPSYTNAGSPQPIGQDGWQVEFTRGGPEIPAARTIQALASWTAFESEDVKRFSGTAVYRTRFAKPAGKAIAWRLDLGKVAQSARVRLNGEEIGVLIGPSFQLVVEDARLQAENVLEIAVSNLMANRIADLERRGVRWKKFYNVNFPARLAENRGPDGLFTAAKWTPLESGLLGPVTLTLLR